MSLEEEASWMNPNVVSTALLEALLCVTGSDPVRHVAWRSHRRMGRLGARAASAERNVAEYKAARLHLKTLLLKV